MTMTTTLPNARERLGEIVGRLGVRRPAVFLDYDGTLTPIVERPEDAVLAAAMRASVARLARSCPVAIVSGRDLEDVRALVALDGLVYAGSHGFDIEGPPGMDVRNRKGDRFLPVLDRAESQVGELLAGIAGAQIERKRYSVAVHYRRVAEAEAGRVEEAVDTVLARHSELRKGSGKKVWELQPDIDWDKGHAVRWLMRELGLAGSDVLPFYLGDDTTDEDAFRVLADDGVGIVVRGDDQRTSAAAYALDDTDDVGAFLTGLADAVERRGS